MLDSLINSTILIGLVPAVALSIVAAMVWLHHAQALAGRLQSRRPLPGPDVIRSALGRSAETGRAVHLSPGSGTLGSRATTAATIAGLLAAERVATEAARNGALLQVSSGDAVAHMALRGIVRQVYQRAGQTQDFDSGSVQLLAHQDPTAYATGVMTVYARQPLEASQLIGDFGQEFLLLGEEGAQRNLPQVGGAVSNAALPVMLLSTNQTLIGEEVFAADAYLSDDVAAQARLRTHDVLRALLIAVLIIGFVYSLLAALLGLPALP